MFSTTTSELNKRDKKNYQASVERTEKFVQAFGRMMTRFVCITKPLECANAHSTIKGTSSKRHTLPKISQQQVTLYFPFYSNV
jgi:hypothetical protein